MEYQVPVPNNTVVYDSVTRNRFSISQTANFSLYRAPLQQLKKVSGRLLRLLQRRTSIEPTGSSKGHLLVVEDEESIRYSMSDYFSQLGFEVDTAREAEEAERLIENTKYDVIIQDLRLGVASHHEGLDVIKFVRKRNPETRIVVLTAYGSPETEDEALRSGADVFLRKPKALSQVAQVVQGLMESPRHRSAHSGS